VAYVIGIPLLIYIILLMGWAILISKITKKRVK